MPAPFFRYGSTNIDFGNEIYSPSYPVRHGVKLHSYTTQKAAYVVTTRKHGTTSLGLKSEGFKKADRDIIYNFWETTLESGYNTFSFVDQRNRVLFESSWDQYFQAWSKRTGGIYDIDYVLKSPVPWTMPSYGLFLMQDDTVDNFNLSGDDLAGVDGVLTDNATDSNVLRLNGSGLKLTGASGVQTGANGTVSWCKSSQYNSLTLFGQFRITAPANDGSRVDLLAIQSNDSSYSIAVDYNTSLTADLYGYIYSPGGTAKINISTDIYHTISSGTWYDVAISYDAPNNTNYIYVIETNTGSTFNNYLESGTIALQFGDNTQASGINRPNDTTWTSCKILSENTSGFQTGTFNYAQNCMVFDGFISPMQFNTLRRLCYMWNNKTTEYPL